MVKSVQLWLNYVKAYQEEKYQNWEWLGRLVDFEEQILDCSC